MELPDGALGEMLDVYVQAQETDGGWHVGARFMLLIAVMADYGYDEDQVSEAAQKLDKLIAATAKAKGIALRR